MPLTLRVTGLLFCWVPLPGCKCLCCPSCTRFIRLLRFPLLPFASYIAVGPDVYNMLGLVYLFYLYCNIAVGCTQVGCYWPLYIYAATITVVYCGGCGNLPVCIVLVVIRCSDLVLVLLFGLLQLLPTFCTIPWFCYSPRLLLLNITLRFVAFRLLLPHCDLPFTFPRRWFTLRCGLNRGLHLYTAFLCSV